MLDNLWVITIIGGFVAAVLSGLVLHFLPKNKKGSVGIENKGKNNRIGNNTVVGHDTGIINKGSDSDILDNKVVR